MFIVIIFGGIEYVKDIFLFLHTGSHGDGNIPLGQRRQRLFCTNIFL